MSSLTQEQATVYLDGKFAEFAHAIGLGDRNAAVDALASITDDGHQDTEKAIWDSLLDSWTQLRDSKLADTLTKKPQKVASRG